MPKPNSEYQPAHWQVHRFGDQVAAFLGDGSTRYMMPAEAREIAEALMSVANSCDTEQFSRSSCGTYSGTTSGKKP